MPSFNEDLLQFIWRHKLLKPLPLITKSGSEVKVLNPGDLNLDSGPDFFNAQIKINDLILAGNIEIHLKTSDWLRHNHQRDKSYDNIILHVVYEHDIELEQNRQNNVEVLELKNLIAKHTLETYSDLVNTNDKLPCHKQLKGVNGLKFVSWMERMTIERLEEKVKRIEHLFLANAGDYTQTFFTLLLRNFGFKVNALPFELIATQLPVHILLKHADNLLQLEALLLGMSGLLEESFEDKYIQKLQNEFEHLKMKYRLIPLKKELFKFSKMRPANFPNLRLAQVAMLVYTHPSLFTQPQNLMDYEMLLSALQPGLDGYWKNHYKIDGKHLEKDLAFGKSSAENVIINTFVPFFFFYSKKLAKPEYSDFAITLLNSCKMEANAKTRLFATKKACLVSAADSQAIINLYDKYCVQRKCIKCGIAAAILNKP